MEQLYALGISCIEFVQDRFVDWESYFECLNSIFSPTRMIEVLFPLMAIVDSVFAAQLLLCLSFGCWFNAILKWWLLEERPYWWIRETTFYDDTDRPVLRQTLQTCETGPGSPSGHSSTAAMTMLLCIMWASHIVNDRQYRLGWWWQYTLYTVCAGILGSVLLARMYAATHFPHQCLAGALIGSFLAPALCIYVSDPYIWRYGVHASYDPKYALTWHVVGALTTIAIGFITYFSLSTSGSDPQGTIKLAFRWCQHPEQIHVCTTPVYVLVKSCGSLLGWALCVTPTIAQYRHYTKNRSVILATVSTGLIMYGFKHIHDNLCTSNTMKYYIYQYILSCCGPMLYLKVIPAVATWPYSAKKVKVE